MSFLRGRSSRPDERGGRAGAGRRADSEYDDYDYAPDDYQQDDDNWSPDEYFSPEGIKGKWAAGSRQGERGGGYDNYGPGPQRPRGSAGRYGRDPRQQDSYASDGRYAGDEYGPGDYGRGDYGPGDYGTGPYEAADGDDDRGERGGGRKRRDRGDRRLRLGRRDKGDDIWPDDGVSDEDYWASVAADRPLNGAGAAPGADPMNIVNNRPMARPSGAARPADKSRSGPERPLGAGEVRLPGDMRSLPAESRSGAGRLGPAPGLTQYPAASHPASNSGPMSRSGPISRSGPMSRSGTGPTATRPATGPNATRAATGPAPVAAAAGRPGTGPNAMRSSTGLSPTRSAAGLAQPILPQASPPQPSFQPHPTTRSSGRQPDLPDWNERTERMDRIAPAAYSEPRLNGGSGMNGTGMNGRGQGVAGSGAHSRRGNDDDPLTSKAFSREELVNTDGRSYRVASRRAQVSGDRYDAALTEQTQAFTMNSQYQSDATAPTPRYPVRGGQQPGQPGHSPQPGYSRQSGQSQRTPLPSGDALGGGQLAGAPPYDRGTGSYPYPSQPYPSRAAGRDQDEDRYGQPGRPAGYDTGHNGNGGRGGNGYGRYNGNGAHAAGNGAHAAGNGAYPAGNGAYPAGNGAYPAGNGGYAGGYGDTRGGNGRY